MQYCENSADTLACDRNSTHETVVSYRSPSEHARKAADSGRPDVEINFSSVKIGAGDICFDDPPVDPMRNIIDKILTIVKNQETRQ